MKDKDWGGNKRTTFASIGASNHAEHERESHDFYATHPIAIDKLVQHPFWEHVGDLIWEPACGMGHMSEALKKQGKEVISSDLIDRGYLGTEVADFLALPEVDCPNVSIVTNPPFKYAEQFIRKALNVVATGKYACFFLKLTFLEGQKRRALFEEYPPKYVLVSSSRIICAMNGDFTKVDSSAVAYAWYIWEIGYKGPTILQHC